MFTVAALKMHVILIIDLHGFFLAANVTCIFRLLTLLGEGTLLQ